MQNITKTQAMETVTLQLNGVYQRTIYGTTVQAMANAPELDVMVVDFENGEQYGFLIDGTDQPMLRVFEQVLNCRETADEAGIRRADIVPGEGIIKVDAEYDDYYLQIVDVNPTH